MRGKYGPVYRVADLIGRAIPKGGHGAHAQLLVHHFIKSLKCLSELQSKNPFITITLQAGGSIVVHYKGLQLLSLHPHSSHIRLGTRIEPINDDRRRLMNFIDSKYSAFSERLRSPLWFYAQWRCYSDELDLIVDFLNDLPVEPSGLKISKASHPRNFSGEVRERALEEFRQSGRICPGVGRERHKVDLYLERIEFDHILPHSQGGSRSERNVQVLCAECNRRKRDTAL